MTIVQLEYLLAIYRYKSFSKAAEKCFVTQPTLSMQIQNLEAELEMILFDRSKKPIQPTDAGIKIIEQAENILQEINRMKDLQHNLKGDLTGELRLGIIPTISPYLLPLFVSGFTESYPSVQLKMEEMVTAEIIQGVRNDHLDIGIVATPLNEKGIYEIPVYKEMMLVYASPKSRIYKEKEIDPAELDTDELWLLNEGHCFRSQILSLCKMYREKKDDFSFTFESGSIDTLIRMVDVHGGFTLVPELILPFLRKDQLQHVRKFKQPMPAREISIITRRLSLKEKQIEVLKEEIIKGVKKHLSKESNTVLIGINDVN
jgi:LysR family hydrogen peroxide-inducible transcriptional activator